MPPVQVKDDLSIAGVEDGTAAWAGKVALRDVIGRRRKCDSPTKPAGGGSHRCGQGKGEEQKYLMGSREGERVRLKEVTMMGMGEVRPCTTDPQAGYCTCKCRRRPVPWSMFLEGSGTIRRLPNFSPIVPCRRLMRAADPDRPSSLGLFASFLRSAARLFLREAGHSVVDSRRGGEMGQGQGRERRRPLCNASPPLGSAKGGGRAFFFSLPTPAAPRLEG
jgi:hypothetical protein